MLQYGDYRLISSAIINQLGLDDAIDYSTWTKATANEFNNKYLNNEDYIRGLVLDELANHDTSDNHPTEINDIVENAISEVFYAIDDIVEGYYQYQQNVTMNVYNEIINSMNNIVGVESVDSEYDPGDPDVGDYQETRTITVKLTNGSEIYFDVEIAEE